MTQAPALAVARPMSLVSVVALTVLVGTTVSTVFHVVMAQVFHQGYPYSTFLFRPSDRFMDFFNVYRHASEFRPGVSGNMVYSPLLHALTSLANLVPAKVAFALLVVTFMTTLVVVLWGWTTSPLAAKPLWRACHVVVLAFLAYPVLFVLDRGNLEMLVFILLAGFFWLRYVRHSSWAWFPLALAIAAKYYWASLLLLLLLDREWIRAMWCAVTAVVVSVVCTVAISLTSGYSVVHVLANLRGTLGGHMDTTSGIPVVSYSHTAWAWVLCSTRWTDYAFYWAPTEDAYVLIALLVLTLVARCLVKGGLADWQKATALVACTLLLPFESKDYTAIHLILPLSLIAAVARPGWTARVAILLIAVLLIPLDYYYLSFWEMPSTVSIAPLVYSSALAVLLVVSLRREKEVAGDGSLRGDPVPTANRTRTALEGVAAE